MLLFLVLSAHRSNSLVVYHANAAGFGTVPAFQAYPGPVGYAFTLYPFDGRSPRTRGVAQGLAAALYFPFPRRGPRGSGAVFR